MNRSLVPIIIITAIFFSVLAVLSAPFARFLLENYFSVKTSQDGWIGFAGNILGGILGGIFTLLGVGYAFGLERKKAMRDGIPNKILNLYVLKEKIFLHKFSKGFHLTTSKQGSYRNATLFLEELKQFTRDKNDLLERASQVDTDIFSFMDNYYQSIRIIIFNLNKTIQNEDSNTTESINQSINDATLFHTFLVKKTGEKIEEKTAKYVEEFHKKKKSKKLLDELDNHSYLSDQ